MGSPWIVRTLAVGVLLAAGCRGRPAAPTPGRVDPSPERREPRYDAAPLRPDEWFEAEIAALHDLVSGGELEEAQPRLAAAWGARPGPEHEERLAEVQGRLLERVLLLKTVSGTVEAPAPHIDIGRQLEAMVRIRNEGEREVRIPAAPRGSSGTLFEFDVVAREYDVRGNVTVVRNRLLLRAEGDLVIPRHGTAEMTLDLGMVGNDRPLDGFRVFTVSGKLRPARLETGPFARWEGIALGSCEIRAFRANWQHLADDPLARLGQAIEKNAPVHLLTACALLEWPQRTAAMDGLVAAVEGSRPIDIVLFTAMEHLTGADLGRSAAAWRAWWPRVRESYFTAPAPPRHPDRPLFETAGELR